MWNTNLLCCELQFGVYWLIRQFYQRNESTTSLMFMSWKILVFNSGVSLHWSSLDLEIVLCSTTVVIFFFQPSSSPAPSPAILFIVLSVSSFKPAVFAFAFFSRAQAVCPTWVGSESSLPAGLHPGGALLVHLQAPGQGTAALHLLQRGDGRDQPRWQRRYRWQTEQQMWRGVH